jgi:hypothetical protein
MTDVDVSTESSAPASPSAEEAVLGLDGLPVDPTLIAEAAALEPEAAEARHAELAAEIEAANRAYY